MFLVQWCVTYFDSMAVNQITQRTHHLCLFITGPLKRKYQNVPLQARPAGIIPCHIRALPWVSRRDVIVSVWSARVAVNLAVLARLLPLCSPISLPIFPSVDINSTKSRIW